MQYDLLIKNGTVVDGSGLPRFQADVAIAEGKIAAIGKIREGAREIIDAEGHVVSPGFVDGHTHMDAQVFWDPLGTCSCWHGITSVVMGNCGFSLAPCSEEDKLLVMRNLERAEDISPEAMQAGIRWSWTTYPEYLDAVERLPKGINYSAYIGHSALRTYVMGERAFTEEATPDDLEAMQREVRSAIQAGAAGFTTSRTRNHQTPDGQPVASRLATWDEVRQLVGVLGELNSGVFEIAGEDTGLNPERIQDYCNRLKALAVDTGVQLRLACSARPRLQTIGVRFLRWPMKPPQPADGCLFRSTVGPSACCSRSSQSPRLTSCPSGATSDNCPWQNRQRPYAILKCVRSWYSPPISRPKRGTRAVGAEARAANFKWLFPILDRAVPPYRSVAEIAAERNQDPVETYIELALEKGFKALLHAAADQHP